GAGLRPDGERDPRASRAPDLAGPRRRLRAGGGGPGERGADDRRAAQGLGAGTATRAARLARRRALGRPPRAPPGLRRGGEPPWGAPEPGAAVGVDPAPEELPQSPHHRLLQPDEEVKGEDLPAVGVAAEEETDPVLGGATHILRLVREKNARGSLRGAGEGEVRTGLVVGEEVSAVEGGDSADDQ